MLVAALLGGCGGASKDSVSTSRPSETASETAPAPVDTTVDADHDNDVGAPYDDANHRALLDQGAAATPAERGAIVALVKRYYAAALAENGALGCALLYSTLAEAAPEDDSREPGTPGYMHGQTTCAGVLHALFRHYHAQLAVELPKLKVTYVRVQGRGALVLLGFGALAERQTGVERERRVWKMSKIYDEEVP
jgi:hypothetical protein